MENIDLHIHSSYSDGDLSIPQLIKSVKDNGIKNFSITDHDNTNSIHEAYQLVKDDVYYIPGVELSCLYDNIKIHLLGYFIKENGYVNELCGKYSIIRHEMLLNFINDLNNKGYIFNKSDLTRFDDFRYTVGKVDLAKLMVKYGYASTVHEAFYGILKDYQLGKFIRVDIKKAINAIKSDDGLAIIAHPGDIENKQSEVDTLALIDALIPLGLDGVEVYNTKHSQSQLLKYKEKCLEKKLIISGGSDYHGPITKPSIYLGQNVKGSDINDIFKH